MLDATLEVNVVEGLVDSSVEVVSPDVVGPGSGPNVHTHSRLLFRRPATGVSGQVSLSDSEDESRLSPVWGDRALNFVRLSRWGNRMTVRGADGATSDEDVDGRFALASADSTCELESEAEGSLDSDDVEVESAVVASEERESVERESVDVDWGDSMSEWASVYFSVRISSTRGVLKDTFFSAGNLGRPDILRESTRSIGLFASIECKL